MTQYFFDSKIPWDRRQFLKAGVAWSAGVGLGALNLAAAVRTTQTKPAGFFTLGHQKDHWWLIDPSGHPFFTLGLNHIDPASLRYPENVGIWRDKYDGSTIKWI